MKIDNIFLYDVHTHSNKLELLKDVENVVSICRDRHIFYNCVGTNIEDSKIAIQQAKKYPDVMKATVGIHPDDIDKLEDINTIEQLYLDNKDVVVAIGEIGLDYSRSDENKQKQKQFFIKFIEMANKYDLPICIHVRDAEEDCLEILKLVKKPSNVWIHCFARDSQLVKKYVDRGYMISIPGIVTFKNAKDVQEAIKYIPLDKMMVETDGPWLAPTPHRGKINYPHYVEFTARDIATRLNIPFEEFAKKVTANAVNFFRLK